MGGADPPQGKLPVAPNMSQILNRISMGLAKHERILSTLKSRPAAPSSPSASAAQANHAAPSGFSSLASVPGHASSSFSVTGATTTNGRGRKEAQDEFEADRALAPNVGVGFVEERKAGVGEKGSRDDKMLRGRLLGKRGGGKDSSKTGGGKRVVEGESEEEEGRSALGKRKKKRRVESAAPVSEGTGGGASGIEEGAGGRSGARGEVDAEKGVSEVRDTALREDGATGAQGPTVPEPQESVDEPEHRGLGMEDDAHDSDKPPNAGTEPSTAADATEQAAEKRKKRKQAKRKRNRANKAAQESGEATEARRADA